MGAKAKKPTYADVMSDVRQPGWYWQDGLLPGQKRYWDGSEWTEKVSEPRGPMTVGQLVTGILVAAAIIFLAVVLAVAWYDFRAGT